MTRQEFSDLAKNYIYLDGATGSNLVNAGMPAGVCPEKWIVDNSHIMLSLQQEYVAAGTDILYAPTFTANKIKLAEYGLYENQEELISNLVSITREAAESAKDRKVYVAGDLTMTGQQLRPLGNLELEELIEIYKEQISYLVKYGVDLLVVETMMSLAETRAAVIAAKEICDLPIIVTLTFESNGRTLFGTDAKTAAIVLEALGVSAVGVNCSTGPGQMQKTVEDMISVTKRIPIIAKPNAGLPYLNEHGKTCYQMNAVEFVEEMKLLVSKGASVLGGCCGTTPEYISGLKATFGKHRNIALIRRTTGTRVLASERMSLEFKPDDRFMIVGERINPTGKKVLQAQLKENCMDQVLQFAEEQELCGAKILDINLGMSGIDEKSMMLKAIEEVSTVTNLPLSLDSSYIDVLEAALRHYPGRALVNSVSYETEKFEKLLPLVKKYGAMFILLPLSDKGLPESIDEKKQIINTIVERAIALGMDKDDIIVDGLVTTIGANQRAALETLETISYCKDNQLATICGLSNISFGMPERCYVNTSFLILAIQAGLTMAIANPSQDLLVACSMATDLLLAKEGSDIGYIECIDKLKEKQVNSKTNVPTTPTNKYETVTKSLTKACRPQLNPTQELLYNSILKGKRNEAASVTEKAIDMGENPQSLLNDVLLPAINEVGELFDIGKYFLPQLINSAEAMKNAIEIIEPYLLNETDDTDKPVVVIATVEGDIHDIGKNLVALMLKNYGFMVIDLGKDVPADTIIREAVKANAQIIALSALMTTTMQKMKEIIFLAKQNSVSAKIMIGGAVITQDYADEIGADGYSKDAAEAVRVAKKLLNID